MWPPYAAVRRASTAAECVFPSCHQQLLCECGESNAKSLDWGKWIAVIEGVDVLPHLPKPQLLRVLACKQSPELRESAAHIVFVARPQQSPPISHNEPTRMLDDSINCGLAELVDEVEIVFDLEQKILLGRLASDGKTTHAPTNSTL